MDQLAALTAGRRYFTRAEALRRGETDQTIHAALRAGVVSRVRYGVYVPTLELDGLGERDRHVLLAHAAAATQRGPVAFAGPTAALARGFDVIGHDLSVVHLARLDSGSARRQGGIVHHQVSPAVQGRVENLGGALVVSGADAIWQTALLSSLEGGVVTADSALHRDAGLREALREVVAHAGPAPRSRTARLALRLARPESESPGESLTRVACYRHGLPCPTLQHDVVDDFGRLLGRSDFYWEEFRLLGEFDGKVKYERYLRQGESAADAVVREKGREDAMRSTNRGMARFVWADVQPGSTGRRMARLRHEMEQSHRLYVRTAA